METDLTPENREKITVSELASLIGHILKEDKRVPNLKLNYPPDLHRHLCGGERPSLRDEFSRKFYEAIALLGRRGLVVYAPVDFWKNGQDKIPHNCILLTSAGRETDFADEILILDDAQKIVNSFDKEISNPDPILSQYHLESIRACQNDLCISSIICLGVASERAVDLLAETIKGHTKHSITGTTAQIAKSLLKDNGLLINQIFDPITDKDFKRELKYQLEKMEGIYHLNRNDAAHPIVVPEITRYEQVCLLLSFRRYAKTIFKAMELLNPSS